ERPIEPTILMKDPGGYRNLAVKIRPGQFDNTIDAIERAWVAQYPDFLFNYEFLEEEIANFYRDTRRLSVLLIIFSGVAIFISCLGLYGLVSYIATQKEREIGVRKVFGARTRQIAYIFSREFVLLITFDALFVLQTSGSIIASLLQNFTSRVHFQWYLFAVGLGLALLIAPETAAHSSLRAGLTRPAKELPND